MSQKKEVENKKTTKSSRSKKSAEISASEKYINPKNYVYAFLILVGGILIAVFAFGWYNAKKEEKFMTSYLIASNTIESSIKDLDALKQIRQEAPSSYFIYIGYTKDEDVYNFEKELKKLIDKYKLNDSFYYVDLTDYMEKDDTYLDKVKDTLDIEDITKVPALIYVQNGEIKNILDGVKDNKLKISDVEELLDIYEFEAIK